MLPCGSVYLCSSVEALLPRRPADGYQCLRRLAPRPRARPLLSTRTIATFFRRRVLLVSVGQGAIVHASECSTVPKSSDRLACYDRATPPIAAKPVKHKFPPSPTAASTSPPEQSEVVDMLAVENSKLDARLKTICRGC